MAGTSHLVGKNTWKYGLLARNDWKIRQKLTLKSRFCCEPFRESGAIIQCSGKLKTAAGLQDYSNRASEGKLELARAFRFARCFSQPNRTPRLLLADAFQIH